MKDIIQKIASAADYLDDSGSFDIADQLDGIARVLVGVKKAQYETAWGHAVRNNRCWMNCYRQKRATQPSKAAQEVWTECWDEYQESLDDHWGGDWNKYASGEEAVSADYRRKFADEVNKKISLGENTSDAIVEVSENQIQHPYRMMIAAADKLTSIAERLSAYEPDIAEQIAQASIELIKEAGPLDWIGNKFRNMRDSYMANRNVNKQEAMMNRLRGQVTRLINTNPILANYVRTGQTPPGVTEPQLQTLLEQVRTRTQQIAARSGMPELSNQFDNPQTFLQLAKSFYTGQVPGAAAADQQGAGVQPGIQQGQQGQQGQSSSAAPLANLQNQLQSYLAHFSSDPNAVRSLIQLLDGAKSQASQSAGQQAAQPQQQTAAPQQTQQPAEPQAAAPSVNPATQQVATEEPVSSSQDNDDEDDKNKGVA